MVDDGSANNSGGNAVAALRRDEGTVSSSVIMVVTLAFVAALVFWFKAQMDSVFEYQNPAVPQPENSIGAAEGSFALIDSPAAAFELGSDGTVLSV